MKPVLLPDGGLLIPVRLEGPDGELGDGARRLEPGDPEYMKWLPGADVSAQGGSSSLDV